MIGIYVYIKAYSQVVVHVRSDKVEQFRVSRGQLKGLYANWSDVVEVSSNQPLNVTKLKYLYNILFILRYSYRETMYLDLQK